MAEITPNKIITYQIRQYFLVKTLIKVSDLADKHFVKLLLATICLQMISQNIHSCVSVLNRCYVALKMYENIQ